MLFDYKITKKCSLNSPLIKIVYESIIVTIIIQVVTTSGTIVLNKNIPYFFLRYISSTSQIKMIITPTKINTGFIYIASACNSGCILNLVIINITTEIMKK